MAHSSRALQGSARSDGRAMAATFVGWFMQLHASSPPLFAGGVMRFPDMALARKRGGRPRSAVPECKIVTSPEIRDKWERQRHD